MGTLDYHTETELTIHVDGEQGIYKEEDFFRLEAAESMPARISIRFDHSQGNLDLFVYDVTETLIGSSESTTDNETVLLDFQQGETYFVRVIGADGATHPEYDLVIGDTLPPEILGIDPPDGAVRGQNLQTVYISFSEPMDTETLTSENFRLHAVGGDDVAIDIQPVDGDRTVELTFGPLSTGDYQVIIDASGVTDLGGEPVGPDPITSTFTILASTIVWDNPNGGSWHTASNWSPPRLPGPADNVLIDKPGNIVVTHSGTTEINSLYSAEEFRLSGGGLTVAEFVQVDNVFSMGGGATLTGATVLPGIAGEGIELINAYETLALNQANGDG